MEFRGLELDFDIYDADQAEVYEAALERVVKDSGKKVPGETLAAGIRRQCKTVFGFFDDLFGEGTHREIFGDRANLRTCLEAFQEFTGQVNTQKEAMMAEFQRDLPGPNRAARRHPVAPPKKAGNRK